MATLLTINSFSNVSALADVWVASRVVSLREIEHRGNSAGAQTPHTRRLKQSASLYFGLLRCAKELISLSSKTRRMYGHVLPKAGHWKVKWVVLPPIKFRDRVCCKRSLLDIWGIILCH